MLKKIGLFWSENKGISWWWFGIKVGIITALVIWWWLENQKKKFMRESSTRAPHDENQSIPLPVEDHSQDKTRLAEAVKAETPESPAAYPTQPDDLTVIEGIGPKINATLQEIGVTTFAQLAASKPAVLKQMLLDAGIRIGFPDTWPEQAALAAKADWDALAELQSGLQGGRRIG